MLSKKLKQNQSTGWSSPFPQGVKAASDWFKLIPFGIYSHPKGIQRFTRPEANEVTNHFKSLRGWISRGFKGLPVSRHAGAPCGSIVKLEVRDDGLWALAKWHREFKDLIHRKPNAFLTPIWALRAQHPDLFTPFKLLKVKFSRGSYSPIPKTTKKLKTKSITEILTQLPPYSPNNRERFLILVHEYMKETGQHYLQSWNFVKKKHPDLFQSF